MRIITKAEPPDPVDTFELIKVAPGGNGLQGECVGGLQHGVAGANRGGSRGFVDVDDGVANDVSGARCTAGVELDALLPDAQQGGVIKALALAVYLDAGMPKQFGGLDQSAAVQVLGVTVEQVADLYGAHGIPHEKKPLQPGKVAAARWCRKGVRPSRPGPVQGVQPGASSVGDNAAVPGPGTRWPATASTPTKPGHSAAIHCPGSARRNR
ncbi:hypothetical protein D3C80_1524680 [compost metagenome]